MHLKIRCDKKKFWELNTTLVWNVRERISVSWSWPFSLSLRQKGVKTSQTTKENAVQGAEESGGWDWSYNFVSGYHPENLKKKLRIG